MPDATGADRFLHEFPIGVWIAKAPGGELEYANGEFTEIMGMNALADVSAGGYSGPYGIFDRAGNSYPEERLPFVRVLQARTSVVVDDLVIRRRDGRAVDVRAYGKPIFDAAGVMTHVVIAFTDMTAEVAAMNEKDLAQLRLRTAVEHAPVVLFAYDENGIVTMAEGSPMERLHLKKEEIVGRLIYDVYANVPEIVDGAHRVLEKGETVTMSVNVDGMEFESWLAPVKDAAGKITGAIGVATDVTERVKMQSGILQSDRMASLGMLAAGVAHELNNPLAYVIESLAGIDDAMILLSEDLGGTSSSSAVNKRLERLRQYAAHAREGAERLRVVTRELRSFSRVDDARHPVDVGVAVESALHLVAKTLETRAMLTTDLGPAPPVYANEARLGQVIVNLAINAMQAIPAAADRTAHEIRFVTRAEPGSAIIEVMDTGHGVPHEIRPHLFEPFFTTKDAAEGTGLGLFVSRNIVEALGGTIEVGDRPGGGALFRVTIPAAPPSMTAPPPPRRRAQTGRAQVLVIEDDPTLGDLMRGALLEDCEVRVARTGAEGLALLVERTWDVVLCDLALGDMTAMELHAKLARECPGREASVVFMTGGAFTPEAKQFLASVPNDRLSKPFDVRVEVRRRLR